MWLAGLCTAIGLLALLATPAAAAGGFDPPALATEFGPVGHARRVAFGPEDARFSDLEAACKDNLQFALRLRPFLRRAIAVPPEQDSATRPHEQALAAGTTLSERRGLAPSYLLDGQPLFLTLNKGGRTELVCLTAAGDSYRVLGRLVVGAEGQAAHGLLLLDLTGNGRLSAVVQLGPTGKAPAGVAVAEIGDAGRLQLLTPEPLPSRNGAVSLVDLDGDGRWELETHLELADLDSVGRPGPYLANQLYRWNARQQTFANATAACGWRYRPEREFYRKLWEAGAWQYSASIAEYLEQSWSIERPAQ
jgi:hypothetical protein